MTAFILPAETRNALLEYLSHRPYREVAQAIDMLGQLAPVPEAGRQPEMNATGPMKGSA